MSVRNFIFRRSMFHFDYIFHTIPQRHVAFDWETFRSCPVRFSYGAMDCATGKTVWFEKETITPDFSASIASCSVPVLSPIVKFQGYELLDGGVSDPIPIEKSVADGNVFHVIVLTRNAGYSKRPFGHEKLLKALYRKHPRAAEAVLRPSRSIQPPAGAVRAARARRPRRYHSPAEAAAGKTNERRYERASGAL